MKHLLLFCLLTFCIIAAQGQEVRSLNLIMAPSSPTAASLSRYVDYPVTMSSGLPNISIPLYEFKSSRITVPISLSYHAGGIRVTDRTSTLGLGWSLIAGGAITRAVVGMPDENPNYGFNNWNYPDSLSESRDGFYYQHFDKDVDLRQITCFVHKTDNTNANSGINLDSSPDYYYYNAQGLMGQFTYGANKKLYTIPYDPIKISGGEAPFIITASDGVTYHFGGAVKKGKDSPATDIIWVDNANPTVDAQQRCVSAWYLTKIISADKSDTVTFHYSTDRDDFSILNKTSVMYVTGSVYGGSPNNAIPHLKKSISHTNESNVRLLDIIGKNGRVHLNYDEETIKTYDNKGMGDFLRSFTIRPLSSIEVYVNFGNKETKVKQFNFQQSFFQSGSYHTPNSLRLDGVTEVGFLQGEPQTNPPYTFGYATDDVPPYNTKNRDLWGFYNAYKQYEGDEDNDNMLLVNLSDPSSSESGKKSLLVDAFNKREANPSMLNKGMLQSITYPTGGYTKFTFEPNSKLASVSEKESGRKIIHTLRPLMGEVDKTFIPHSQAYSRTLELKGQRNQTYSLLNEPRVILKDETDNTIILDVWLVTLSGGNKENESKTVEVPKLNPNHTYRLYFPTPFSRAGDNIAHYDLNAYLTEELPTISSTKERQVNAGGLRIKSIEHRNSLASNTIKKEYNYTESYWNSDAFTGDFKTIKAAFGKQLYFPPQASISTPLNKLFDMKNMKVVPIEGCYVHQESPTYSVGSPNSSVSYSKVEELQVTATGTPLGKTEYTFNTGIDMITTGAARAANWRQQVKIDRSFIRSQLLSKKVFKCQKDSWTLIQETQNFYNNINDLPFNTKGTEFIRRYVAAYLFDDYSWTEWTGEPPKPTIGEDEDCLCPRYLINIPLEFHTMFVNIVRPILDSTITREKGASDHWIRNKTAYSYSNLSHMKPTEISTSRSDGSTLTQQVLYSTDGPRSLLRTKEPELVGVNKLRLANITTPIETISFLQRKGETTKYLLDATINYYNPVLPVVDAIATIGLTTPYDILKLDEKYKIRFDYKYDAKGLLAQQHKTGNFNETFLWGYNNAYPIAKLDNMDYSQVLSNATLKSYIDQLQNYTLLTDANVRSTLKVLNTNIRNQVPQGVSITTYTYAPLIGITSQTSPNGVTTYYEYDSFGRLARVKNSKGEITTDHQYAYYDKASLLFYNSEISKSIKKNDCPHGSLGSNVTYTVPEGKYTSTISQSDADYKASSEISSMGQAAANASGSCYTFIVDTLDRRVSPLGEDFKIDVTSNVSYRVASDCSWLICSTGEGSENGSVSIKAIPNTGDNRRGIITFTPSIKEGNLSKKVVVNQEKDLLETAPSSLNFSMNEHLTTVRVWSRRNWFIANSSGNFFSAQRIEDQNSIEIKCDFNSTKLLRSGSITISNGFKTATITINQSNF